MHKSSEKISENLRWVGRNWEKAVSLGLAEFGFKERGERVRERGRVRNRESGKVRVRERTRFLCHVENEICRCLTLNPHLIFPLLSLSSLSLSFLSLPYSNLLFL